MLLALIWFVGFASVAARLPAQELESLRVIAGRLGKGDWDFDVDPCSGLSGWATRNPVQGFENAVTCDCGFGNSTTCHVTSIVLNAQNLNGSLPVEFVRLQFLQQIELSRNFLYGTIPPQWGSLKFVNISLNGNRITGSIPEELANITSLQQLDLEYNQLSGTIPPEFGDLPQIRRLLFTSNNLTGELPPSLAKLTTLTDFRVSDNNFIGSIPNFIQNLTNMEKLVIQASGLAGPIPSGIASLTKMTDLRISDLNGNDSSLPSLSPLKKLKTLILRSCNIVGTLPEYIGNMTTLKLLDLSFNKLKGPLPESFINLSKTEYIYLTGNSLTGPLPDWMLKDRKGIDLSYNNLTYGSLPAECRNSEVLISCFSTMHAEIEEKEIEEKQVIAEAPNTGKKLRKLREHNFRSLFYVSPSPALSAAPSPEADAPGEDRSSIFGGAMSVAPSPAPDASGEGGSSTSGGAMTVTTSLAPDASGEGGSSTSGGAMSVTPSLAPDASGEGGSSTSGGAISVAPSAAPDASGGAKSVAPSPAAKASGGGGSSISGGAIAGIVMVAIFAVILVLGVLWWKGCLTRKDSMHNDLKGGSFTLRQLKVATNNFAPANKIGEGGFGPVFKGVLSDGTIIAVKQLSSKSKQGNREFVNEIGMISALQHPNLVKLYGCCMEGNQLMLVYEYMENNNLARALFGLEHQLHLDWPMRQKICVGIARGLAYLHEESRLKIVHRDIKATNVLLDKKLVPKISDFGLAKLHEEEDTHISTRIAGTFGYMAPEYAMRGYLTDKADVYSFGVVVLEIVSGRSNISIKPKEDNFYLLDWAISLKAKGNLLELVDPRLESTFNKEEMARAINVALICTNVVAAERPSISAVVTMLEGKDDIPKLASETRISVDKTRPGEVEMGTLDGEGVSMDAPRSGSSNSAADLYPLSE
ncbi:probable leucine-rich repeat receptor-like serine/threonine-protein kinase At3g14840 [Salvia splendens]|uniref:probable leucine-rich repeat receptor-like serine/threonine-protein kinase At3g14840 n=1 Tax=Salvia splendens TaxID=180675 RepID=UPI001C266ACA|nr:probable leucine-rich repeat receptor-like serine/threonine-protein kinase At3g14840 [Salvia splendens]